MLGQRLPESLHHFWIALPLVVELREPAPEDLMVVQDQIADVRHVVSSRDAHDLRAPTAFLPGATASDTGDQPRGSVKNHSSAARPSRNRNRTMAWMCCVSPVGLTGPKRSIGVPVIISLAAT